MLHKPTSSPALPTPTATPTTRSPISNVYEYTIDSTKCSFGENNIQGPALLADKSDVALQFFAFGDTPYDNRCNTCNTCIENGQPVADCTLYLPVLCTVKNDGLSSLGINNTCTYEGDEYNCLKESILPYMQAQTVAGEGAFSVHVGDIIKGARGVGGNYRCQDSSFTSRMNLFQDLDNFLLLTGGVLDMICVICL